MRSLNCTILLLTLHAYPEMADSGWADIAQTPACWIVYGKLAIVGSIPGYPVSYEVTFAQHANILNAFDGVMQHDILPVGPKVEDVIAVGMQEGKIFVQKSDDTYYLFDAKQHTMNAITKASLPPNVTLADASTVINNAERYSEAVERKQKWAMLDEILIILGFIVVAVCWFLKIRQNRNARLGRRTTYQDASDAAGI
jgi:hypothetical protein